MQNEKSTSLKGAQAGCECGQHRSQELHDQAKIGLSSSEQIYGEYVQEALLQAIIPDAKQRRLLLKSVGLGALVGALSEVLPISTAVAMAADSKNVPEKKSVSIGFLPITCSTPILLGEILGLYEKQNLNVKLNKAAGWPVLKDKTVGGEFDASHMLAPMALGSRFGLGGTATALVTPLLENLNGSSLVLATKHKQNRDPKSWKGMKFAVPSDLSVQNLLLREFLVKNGINPESDVQIKPMAPPEMMSSLKSNSIDGFMGAEPFGQRAVHDGIGFIQLLSAELWDGHPCCVFTMNERILRDAPNTFAALFRCIIEATRYTDKAENWPNVISALSAPEYLNQPSTVIEQVLTGKYADGLANNKTFQRRVVFEPFPFQSMAVWILAELKRWGYIKKDVNYNQISESVFLATEARKYMLDLGLRPGKQNSRKHLIMGKEFDAENVSKYLELLPPIK